MITDQISALKTLDSAMPIIRDECLSVLGSELHYQAMIYHILRTSGGVPVGQIGMNVKQWIGGVVTDTFLAMDARKHKDFQGGFEPIPDIVIFSSEIEGDWRRRNNEATLKHMLLAIEVKASERKDGRLRPKEIETDIRKLAAHRDEVRHTGGDFTPLMLVIDSAPLKRERMTEMAVSRSMALAENLDVEWRYVGCT